jgi:predicted small lipoprotein YifL
MSHLHRHWVPFARLLPPGLLLFCLLLVDLSLAGCGQKGDLYLAEDDPERAERDARGRVKTFPFPDTSKPWPPAQSPTTDSASATPPEPARPADASP